MTGRPRIYTDEERRIRMSQHNSKYQNKKYANDEEFRESKKDLALKLYYKDRPNDYENSKKIRKVKQKYDIIFKFRSQIYPNTEYYIVTRKKKKNNNIRLDLSEIINRNTKDIF